MRDISPGRAEFEAVVELGSRFPVLGRLLDLLIDKAVDKEALALHMREEAAHLESALRRQGKEERHTKRQSS